MSDPRQGDWPDATEAGGDYPANTDPAYSGHYPGQYWGPGGPPYQGTGSGYDSGYDSGYGSGYGAPITQPTEQLPANWQQGAGYPPGYPAPPPPPPPPKSPRWLWIAAAAAVLLVAGLVLALVIVSSSSRESTTVAPLPQSTTTSPRQTPMPRSPTATRAPIPLPIPIPTRRPTPGATPPRTPADTAPGPTGTETVVYNVTGEGRAINITYVDTGGIMQTEFNVALPWNREVSLAAPAKNSASVAIVNIGRDVTCSVSVNGAQVRQRTGRGLTICTGAG